jgi:hypothetical protein
MSLISFVALVRIRLPVFMNPASLSAEYENFGVKFIEIKTEASGKANKAAFILIVRAVSFSLISSSSSILFFINFQLITLPLLEMK